MRDATDADRAALGASRQRAGPPERLASTPLLWLAAGAAFSPVLWDLAMHLWEQAWGRYILLFPLLLLWCGRERGRVAAAPRSGIALLAAGLSLELLALGGGVTRLGRPGMALAVMGLCRYSGFASLRTAALALWMIPVPHLIVKEVQGWTGGGLIAAAAGIGAPFGVELGNRVDVARAGASELALLPSFGGLCLMAMLAGLAWFDAARRDLSGSDTLRKLCLWSLLALPVQLTALLLAFGLLLAGVPEMGYFLLLHALWPLTAAVMLVRGRRGAIRMGVLR